MRQRPIDYTSTECKKRQAKADQRNLLLFSYLLLKRLFSLVLIHFRFLWLFGFLSAMSGVSVSVRTQCEWAWYRLSGCTYTIYMYI